jgi:tRNA A37 N6-isopentenylltransferase MiaA
VAKFLDTEIISTDSRQIYKQMDIGTGKIKEDEKE